MKARWTQEIEREANGGWTRWIPIEGDKHRIACCDCGLVHDLEFAASEDETQLLMRARRNKRSTAQWRRHRVAQAVVKVLRRATGSKRAKTAVGKAISSR